MYQGLVQVSHEFSPVAFFVSKGRLTGEGGAFTSSHRVCWNVDTLCSLWMFELLSPMSQTPIRLEQA